MKLTKQGVRDLNGLGPKPEPRRDLPPAGAYDLTADCKHKNRRRYDGGKYVVCDDCGKTMPSGVKFDE